jgi:hypothetical protein
VCVCDNKGRDTDGKELRVFTGSRDDRVRSRLWYQNVCFVFFSLLLQDMMNLKVVEWKLEIKYVPARDDRATCYIAYIQYEIRFFLGVDCQSWIIVLLKKRIGTSKLSLVERIWTWPVLLSVCVRPNFSNNEKMTHFSPVN